MIEEFLPKQMSEAEAKEAIAAVIKEIGAASPKDMGKVMAALKAALRRPDGLRQGQRAGEGAAEVGAPRHPVEIGWQRGPAAAVDRGEGICERIT